MKAKRANHRAQFENQYQFEAFSLLKLDEQSLQMREETELFAALAHEITEKIESGKKEPTQNAIDTISSIISFYSKVNTYFTHLVPLWYEMITKTLYPWIDLIDHLVSNHGYR